LWKAAASASDAKYCNLFEFYKLLCTRWKKAQRQGEHNEKRREDMHDERRFYFYNYF
jgi:hypothetical protein